MPRGRVRPFVFEDAREIAQLWVKAFAPRSALCIKSLERYFEEVFLASPWSDCNLSSLVYEDEGRAVGFIGVLPRRMHFSGRSVTVAVASQLMIEPGKPRPFVPLELLRQFFAGPQDLSLSDGANDVAQTLWQSAGGSVAMLYSSIWTRVLRPAQYSMTLCEDRRILAPIPRALRPICRAVDGVAARITPSPYRFLVPEVGKVEPVLDESILLDCVREFSAGRTLRPDYDAQSFRWLIGKATEQKTHGDLHMEVVRGEGGEILGSYVYYVKPGRTAQVLQLTGKQRHRTQLLEHLFYSARQKGAVAISGQLEPAFARALSKNHCAFTWSSGVLIHSREEKLLNAIHYGDAFLSRLEGEWWMKFCDMAAS